MGYQSPKGMKASTNLLSKHHIDVIAGRTEKQAATLGELVALAEEVQRISITTDEGSVWLDSRNRGGAAFASSTPNHRATPPTPQPTPWAFKSSIEIARAKRAACRRGLRQTPAANE